MQFLKKLESTEATRAPAVADSKTSNASTTHTVLSLVGQAAREAEDLLDEESDEDKRKRLNMPYVEGKMHLPPHWRHAAAPEDTTVVASAEDRAAAGATSSPQPGEEEPETGGELPLD
jgi:hypothetical protein